MTFSSRFAVRLTRDWLIASMILASSPALLAQAKSTPAAAAAPVHSEPATTVDRASAYYHYGLAKMYEDQAVQSGRQDLATQSIEQYKLALSADPDSKTLSDGLANLYFNLGRIREAVSAAKDQVARHPEDVQAHTLLGRTYLRSLGNGEGQQSQEILKAAIAEYETIAKLKPKDIETRTLLGQLYGLSHDSVNAEAQFKAALAIDPESEEATLSLARLYTEEGDLKKAAGAIAQVPEGDRTVRESFALAGIYDQLKQPTEAIAAYKAVLAEDPDNADAKKGLAQALLASGQGDAAAQEYAKILSTDPNDAQALIRQAQIQRQEGKYEEALATLKKASALVSENLELEFNEALVYDALGRFDESVKMFKLALAQSASPDGKYSDQDRYNRWLFLDRLGNVYREQGKYDDAVAVYKEMSALGGEFAGKGMANLVETYRDAHNWKGALEAAKEAAAAAPNDHDAQFTYARQLADSGKLEEGIKLAEAQLGSKKDDSLKRDVYLTTSDMYARAKRYKEASAALDQVEVASTKPEEKALIYYYRGHIADVAKMYDQAEVEFRKGLAITPDSPAILNDYGYMLAERGVRLDEAVKMLKKANDADPQNGAYLDSLAWAYYKQGQYQLAESYARKAVQRLGTDPTLLDHLGEIEAKNGKLQGAVNEWERAMAQYNTSLAADADPADVAKVQHKLDAAKVKLAKLNGAAK